MEKKLEEFGEQLLRIPNMMKYAGAMFLAADEIRELRNQLNESRNKKVSNVVRPVSVD